MRSGRRRIWTGLVLVGVAPWLVGACSGGGDDGDDRPASSASDTSTTSSTSSTSTSTPASTTTVAAAGATTTTMTTGATAPTFPRQVEGEHGGKAWAVYLAVVRDGAAGGEAKLRKAIADAEAVGYHDLGTGDIDCDTGARQGLALSKDENVKYTGVALYFATQADAKAFVDAFEPGVVGTVQVSTGCMD